ncbi:beta-ribofuranosylaminobenzene 5'-phosphate synthase family protein (plasmid) [Agrobacterium sp. rho-13.3]|uniref:beta-ribofuranosylaminobenzene 5'-phosphate synthase family protein n=1 Tax=Agrobacterium sp. rho-13.3 TaxID=3072980 RepID=UPI0039B75E89
MIEIKVPARVHGTLIGLSADGYRINGGVGWAVDHPSLVVKVRPATECRIVDLRACPLGEEENRNLVIFLSKTAADTKLTRGFRVELAGELPAHKGLGGGTAVRLAILEALFLLNDRPYTPEQLINLSRRGGTSGVGIRTYFQGGFHLDLGHKTNEPARPSNQWVKPHSPLSLFAAEMPAWQIGIFVPSWIPSVTHAMERRLFSEKLPITSIEVWETLYHATYGLAASISEVDATTFCTAVDALQATAWKRAEWQLHGAPLEDATRILRLAGAEGIGLTSIGPSLYFYAESFDARLVPKAFREAIYLTTPSVGGRQVLRR